MSKAFDILIEYIISIPEYLEENKSFKNILVKKMIEFINEDVNESYIETAHMMDSVRLLHVMISDMN